MLLKNIRHCKEVVIKLNLIIFFGGIKMLDIRSVFVEKKKGFNVEAKSLLNDFKR